MPESQTEREQFHSSNCPNKESDYFLSLPRPRLPSVFKEKGREEVLRPTMGI